MIFNKTVVRRIDNSNIVVHPFKGYLNDGTTFRMDDSVTYHGTIESALRRVRNDMRSRVLEGEESVDDIIKKFLEIDKKFIKMLKDDTNLYELHELMSKEVTGLKHEANL